MASVARQEKGCRMSGAVNVGNGMEEESRSLGVIELEHEGTSYKPKRKLSLQARYVYGFIFFLTNLLAWLVRDYGHKILKDLPCFFSDQGYCGSEGHDCFYGESVVRVSFGCFTFFLVMFVTTFRACKLQEAYNSWHSKWWSLKFILWATSMIVSFIIPVAFIKLYGEMARIGAGVFLFLQLISVIHFLDWCDNYWMSDSESKKSCFLGLFISTLCYIASFCAIVLMFVLYAPEASCALNIFFISWTLVLIKVMMIVSLHSKVNTGLLSSGIMGLYVVFLCWSVIKSEPPLQRCNTQEPMTEKDDWTTIVSFLIAICTIVTATFSTGINSKTFQFCKDRVQTEDDIPYQYGFFHFIFSIGSMYFAMLFISWELNQPNKKWRIDVGWASMWVKVLNEWFAVIIYLWNLISSVIKRGRGAGHEQHVQHCHVLA